MDKNKNTTAGPMLQEALLDDREFFKSIISEFCQDLLEEEMKAHLKAGKYERSSKRSGLRNSYKPGTIKTRVGTLRLLVPQDRDGSFSNSLFERYQRSEKALDGSITSFKERPLKKDYPALSRMLEDDISESLTYMNYPIEHWSRIRTINVIERLNSEIKRRTDVVRIFPNAPSALRLIASVCIEQNEEWITGKKYLNMEYLKNLNKMKRNRESENTLVAIT